ncbi:MAG: hypothetical protein PHU46_11190 [Rhodocyclaceae bacterium]|nr:hypothetical protein [Rhodocyclaceae bacterium]
MNPDLPPGPAAGPTAPVPFVILGRAWLALSALTLMGLGLGTWFHGAAVLPVLVAGVIWLKGALVARDFLESGHAHPFIRRVLWAFIGFAPLMLLVTSFLGNTLVRWTRL